MTAAPHDLREALAIWLLAFQECNTGETPADYVQHFTQWFARHWRGAHMGDCPIAKVKAPATCCRCVCDNSLAAADAFLAGPLATLTADLAQARAERDAAIRAMSEHAMARGEAEGALRAAEMPGVVDGWRERAEKAEAEIARLRGGADAVREGWRIVRTARSRTLRRAHLRASGGLQVQFDGRPSSRCPRSPHASGGGMTILCATADYLVEFEAGYLIISRYQDGHCKAWKRPGLAGDFRKDLKSCGAVRATEVYLRLLRRAEWEPLYKPTHMPGADPAWDEACGRSVDRGMKSRDLFRAALTPAEAADVR